MSMETASLPTTAVRSTTEAVILRAPPAIRAAINRNRQAMGLRPVHPAAETRIVDHDVENRPGVWITTPEGRLIPAPTRAKPAPPKPAAPRRVLVDRVLLMPVYGDADARHVGGFRRESVSPVAFGSAADLNRDGGWDLRCGHAGPRLQIAGERLRAHDTPAGLVVEWIPDTRFSWCRDAMRAISEGRTAVSVGMKIGRRRQIRVPSPTDLIVEARLAHVALLLDGEARPCYPGARSMLFRSSRKDDPAELREQIAKLLDACRWHARHRAR